VASQLSRAALPPYRNQADDRRQQHHVPKARATNNQSICHRPPPWDDEMPSGFSNADDAVFQLPGSKKN
jgi:hypothetical protein